MNNPEEGFRYFKNPNHFNDFLDAHPQLTFLGHYLKFDLKTLMVQLNIPLPFLSRWQHDTLLAAHVSSVKVPTTYIEAYEQERLAKNRELPVSQRYRQAGALSLKVLAPYFLGVPAFWENTETTNDVEYLKKDVVYTAKLFTLLQGLLQSNKEYDFYKDRQLPWSKMLLTAELTGIALDPVELQEQQDNAEQRADTASKALTDVWMPYIKLYEQRQQFKIHDNYKNMLEQAFLKCKQPTPEKYTKLTERYKKLEANAQAKAPPFNIDSTDQLKWLFAEQLELNIVDKETGKQSTDKKMLQSLAQQGRQDVKLLLEYRKQRKLSTTYFPKYKELQVDGRIHCNFNPAGTKTGRLSSSDPNLQQVAGALHSLFVADPGCTLITRDVSALEPTLIAYFSEDPELIYLIQNNISFHSHNAKQIFNLTDARLDAEVDEVKTKYAAHRDAAKEFGLSVLYGAGAKRVKASLDKRGFNFSEEQCRTFVERLRKTYHKVWEFKKILDSTLENGEVIVNFMGRPIHFEHADEVYMKGFNRLIQGSGSDIVQDSAYKINKSLHDSGIDGTVLLLVHDELVVNVPKEQEEQATKIIEDCMTGYKLETQQATLRFQVEGNNSRTWSK